MKQVHVACGKIVIFHTKYPKKKFKCAPPNLKSWIRPWKQVAKIMSCHTIISTRIRGGSRISSQGGGALKKIAPSGGRRENFWGISCEKSRFYAKKITILRQKKSYFSNFRVGARNFWSVSCEKSRFYAKKNHIFSNLRGGGGPPCAPPLRSPRTFSVFITTSVELERYACVLRLLSMKEQFEAGTKEKIYRFRKKTPEKRIEC